MDWISTKECALQEGQSVVAGATEGSTSECIAIIGLGYVGLPVAVAFAKHFKTVIGFDISSDRIDSLALGHDWTGEISAPDLRSSRVMLTKDSDHLKGTTFFVVTVPTPVNRHRYPDLGPLESACRAIGPYLQRGAVVVFESTVYPGLTEDFCGPILESTSGLVRGSDFKLGYSPERINPGDKEHRLENIIKVVAGEDDETRERVAQAYRAIIKAGVYRAASIRVAEAAKVLENTQRDLNIALMNELALIMDRMGLRTKDVLDAAGTKWNFLKFTPGLVGGHCIGVDPFYLTSAAEAHGYHPHVILAGRRVNEDMGRFIGRKLVKLLIEAGIPVKTARVGILGLTFKEDIPDLRNSKIVDIVNELHEFGIEPLVDDPHADPKKAIEAYSIKLTPLRSFGEMDALILAVNHSMYADAVELVQEKIRLGGILVDVKSVLDPERLRPDIRYWSL